MVFEADYSNLKYCGCGQIDWLYVLHIMCSNECDYTLASNLKYCHFLLARDPLLVHLALPLRPLPKKK